MNKIPNRQAICEVLMDKAKEDKDANKVDKEDSTSATDKNNTTTHTDKKGPA